MFCKKKTNVYVKKKYTNNKKTFFKKIQNLLESLERKKKFCEIYLNLKKIMNRIY